MLSDTPHGILAKLLERRQEIAREAASLDALIKIYETRAARSDPESHDASQLNLYAAPSTRALRNAETARAIDAARRLILATNRPMKRGELVDSLERQGFILPGKDKNKVFGTNLWRSGKFRTVGDEGYWPKDTPMPKPRDQ